MTYISILHLGKEGGKKLGEGLEIKAPGVTVNKSHLPLKSGCAFAIQDHFKSLLMSSKKVQPHEMHIKGTCVLKNLKMGS